MKYKPNSKSRELSVNDQEEEYSVNTYSIHEAKTNFSKLVKRAMAGETIYIGSFGKPEVALMIVDEKEINAKLRAKAFGCMKGKMELPEGWDDPLPDDIIESFYSLDGWEEFLKK
jgi:prevent-host-death family protein